MKTLINSPADCPERDNSQLGMLDSHALGGK